MSSWTTNTEVALPEICRNFLLDHRSKVWSDFYRSRINIDTSVLNYMLMPFRLPDNPPEVIDSYIKIYTYAMPRAVDDNNVAAQVLNNIDSVYNHTAGRLHVNQYKLIVYNTSSNQAPVDDIIKALVEEKNAEVKDFRTALTCTPFHKVTVLHLNNTVIVFTNVYTTEIFLKLGAVLPVIYGLNVPVSFLNTYLEGNKIKFIEELEKILKPYLQDKVRRDIITALNDLETTIPSMQRNTLQRDIDGKRSQIRNYEDALQAAYNALNELLYKDASTLWQGTTDNITAFVNYIKEYNLNNITKLSFSKSDCSLYVTYISELLYWNEDYFKRYSESNRSNCYNSTSEPTQALLNNIFLDKAVTVIFETSIRINFLTNVVERYRNTQPFGQHAIGLPHPHIYHHNCWGDNAVLIRQAFGQKDYIVLWEQIKAVLSAINLSDTTVFSEFIEDIDSLPVVYCLRINDTGELFTCEQFFNKYPNGYVKEEEA